MTGIAFEGGGVAGIAHLGVIKYLHEKAVKITYAAGSSAGSIMALLVSLQLDYPEIHRIVSNTKLSSLVSSFYLGDLIRLIGYYGWNSTLELQKVIQDIVGELTFREHFAKFECGLIVTATHYNTGSTVYYNHVDSPEKKIWEAVVESCSIPLYFTPTYKKDQMFVDGGMLDNYPIRSLYHFLPPEHVIGSKLVGKYETKFSKPRHLLDYIQSLINILLNVTLRSHVKKADWLRTIKVNIGTVTATDFNLTLEQQNILINNGYQAALDYFAKDKS